jgi:hypothetical protein
MTQYIKDPRKVGQGNGSWEEVGQDVRTLHNGDIDCYQRSVFGLCSHRLLHGL